MRQTNKSDIYLDNAASTPVDARVLAEYCKVAKDCWGNPSNVNNNYGVCAKDILERSRFNIGETLGLDPRGIIFTSGATEANNLALKGIDCLQNGRCAIAISAIEHPCIEQAAGRLQNMGITVKMIPVLPNGTVDLNALQQALASNPPIKLVSIMAVNNETGVVQPINQIADLAHTYGALCHTDATQAIGKAPLDFLNKVDMMSLSGHKINGPKGIGALWVRPGINMHPMLQGGGQESGLRSGTTPVPLVAALAKALKIACKDTKWTQKLYPYLKQLETTIQTQYPEAHVNGLEGLRTASVSNIAFPYQTPVIDNITGVALSAASACSCSKPEPSRVLQRMGLPENYAANALRVSIGKVNTPKEIQRATTLIMNGIEKSKNLG